MRVALVSAIFGGIDQPKSVPPQSVSHDLHQFTEHNSPFPLPDLDDRMRAKYFKLQTHRVLPDYDAYVWIDGSVQIESPEFLASILRMMPIRGITLNPHPLRSGIVEEADYILGELEQGSPYFEHRYQPDIIKAEVEFCLKEGYQDDLGLFECGVFARPNTGLLNDFFDDWWRHCLTWCCFDQNAFPYLAWKHKLDIIPFKSSGLYRLVSHVG